MFRRQFVAAVGAASVGGSAGCIRQAIGSDMNPLDRRDPLEGKRFGRFGNPGFHSIEWINLTYLRVNFQEDHDIDGMGIMHAYEDSYDADHELFRVGAPTFGGHLDFPLIRKIRNQAVVYPNRRFQLVAYEGGFGAVDLILDVLGTVNFRIPASIAPAEKFDSMD